MDTNNLSGEALQRILQKLREDLWEIFREYTVLGQRAEVVSVDLENLTRVIRTQLFLSRDDDGFDFAKTVPSSFVIEEWFWTLTWHDPIAFNEPDGFEESDYDPDDIDTKSVGWDDPDLPIEVFEVAISQIDWWASGELLEEWEQVSTPSFAEAPVRLRPYLQNAVALYRLQTLGLWSYIKYMLTHPKFLWQRVSWQGLWRSITPNQIDSFFFQRNSK